MKPSDRESIINQLDTIDDIGELSDGYHTYNSLYYQRLILFATIVNQNPDISWKSLRHEDGELCFGGGWFIVGIDTPEGSYTYHYETKDFDLFQCPTLEKAKHWDGHTDKDVTRLLSLPLPNFKAGYKQTIFDGKTNFPRPKGEWIELPKALDSRELPCKCSSCGHILSFMNYYPKSNFCPNCGAEMGGKE